MIITKSESLYSRNVNRKKKYRGKKSFLSVQKVKKKWRPFPFRAFSSKCQPISGDNAARLLVVIGWNHGEGGDCFLLLSPRSCDWRWYDISFLYVLFALPKNVILLLITSLKLLLIQYKSPIWVMFVPLNLKFYFFLVVLCCHNNDTTHVWLCYRRWRVSLFKNKLRTVSNYYGHNLKTDTS